MTFSAPSFRSIENKVKMCLRRTELIFPLPKVNSLLPMAASRTMANAHKAMTLDRRIPTNANSEN